MYYQIPALELSLSVPLVLNVAGCIQTGCARGLIYDFLLLSCGIRLLMFQPCFDRILIFLTRSLIYYSAVQKRTFNYFPWPRLKTYTFLCDGHTNRLIGLSMFQNLLWVYGMAWMSVRFPGMKFCPIPPLIRMNVYWIYTVKIQSICTFYLYNIIFIIQCFKCIGWFLMIFVLL